MSIFNQLESAKASPLLTESDEPLVAAATKSSDRS
jgi:hypothetical protein